MSPFFIPGLPKPGGVQVIGTIADRGGSSVMAKSLFPKALLQGVVLCLLVSTAWADLPQERQSLEQYYHQVIPQVHLADYVLGTLAFNPGARQQVENLMGFPPYELDMDAAQERWKRPLKSGKTLASCFPEGAAGKAMPYPRFDSRQQRVVTFEEALNQCLRENQEQSLPLDDKTLGLLSIQGKMLFNGRPVEVVVESEAAKAAWEDGRRYYYQPRGPNQRSCASCHVQAVGKEMGGNPVSPLIGQGTHWPLFRNGGTLLVTLQQRFQQCNRGLGDAAPPLGSETYNNLEFYLTSLSNGLPNQLPVIHP
jgi:sulfur-oxidizing protein SoxA